MRLSFTAIATLLLAPQAASQSYSHNYESFFGKDDRIGLYSQAANKRFPSTILRTIRDNTLLIDCGSSGKPSTAFVAKTKNGSKIISAAHNLTMAENNALSCELGNTVLPAGRAASNFEDSGTLADAAYDIANWPNITSQLGFDICDQVDLTSKYMLVQSLDGSGRLGISPECKVKTIKGDLITTTCRGHYKASGAPLLTMKGQSVCVAGVFNAHSGKLFGYESYAARVKP